MKTRTWYMMGFGLMLCLTGCGWEHPDLPEGAKPSHQQSGTTSSQVLQHNIADPAVNVGMPMKRATGFQIPASKGIDIPGTNTTAGIPRLGQRALRNSWVQRVGQEIVPGGMSTSAVRVGSAWYVVGYFSGTIEIQGQKLTSAGGEDGFLAKFDLQGVLQWAIAVGGKGDDRVLDVTGGCRNQLYLVGYFAQEMVLGGTTLKTSAASDGFVAELTGLSSLRGISIRAQAAGFANGGNFHQIAVSPNTCHLFLAQVNQSQISIVSWLPEQWGTPQWSLAIQTSASEGVMDLQIDTKDHLVVLGSFFRWAGIGPKHTVSGYGVFVACFDTAGEVKWVLPIQSQHQQGRFPFSVALRGDIDRVVVAGASVSGLVLDDKTFPGSAFVAAFNLQGKSQWVASLPEGVVPDGIILEQKQTYLLGRFNKSVQLGRENLQLPAEHGAARFLSTFDQQGEFVNSQIVMSHESGEEGEIRGVVSFAKEQEGEFVVVANFSGEAKSAEQAVYTKTNAFLLLKTTTQGKTAWIKASGNGNSEVWVRAAAVDKQGYLYRVISFAGKIVIGNQSFDSQGQWIHLLLKQEQGGALVWAQRFRALPVNPWSSSLRMTLGSNGSPVVAGGFSGCTQFGRTSLCSPVLNGYLARWSKDGDFLGARLLRDSRRIKEQPISQIDDVVQAADGTITVVYRETNQAYLSQWSGDLSWMQELAFGGTYPSRTVLAADGQANVYLQGGAYAPNLQFGHISLETEKDKNWSATISGFVAKMDRTGRFVWAKSWWNELPYTGRYILSDEKGNLTITGAFRGTAKFGDRELTSGRYDIDGFAAQLDTHGQVKWALSFHTAEAYSQPDDRYYYRDESGLSLARDAHGHIYLLGSFYRGVQIGKFAIQAKQRGAQFLAKLSSTGEVLWAEHTNASIGQFYVEDEYLLLLGQVGGTEFLWGQQTFNVPNNNTDLYARISLPAQRD